MELVMETVGIQPLKTGQLILSTAGKKILSIPEPYTINMKFFNHQRFAELMYNYSQIAREPKITKDQEPLKNMIALLEKFRHHDEFYTLFNIKEQQLTWNFAMDTFMGHNIDTDDNKKKTAFYQSLIHPFVADWANIYMAGMYKCLLEQKFKNVDYLQFRYVVNLPMIKSNGTYMLVKQISMPFEFDTNGLMISHINSCFIIDKYKGEPLKPRIFHLGKRMKEEEQVLFQECLDFIVLDKKKNTLSHDLAKMANLILEIPGNNKGNLAKELHRKKGGTPEAKPDYKAVNRVRDKLAPLFKYDETLYTKEECHEFDKSIPDLNDPWTITHFAHDSRVLRILELLRNSHTSL
jgi:hypothetical protein